MSRPASAPRLQGLAWVAVTAFGWGLNWPAVKFALSQWPAFGFRVITNVIGMALLLAIAAGRGEPLWPRGRPEWGRLAVAGLLNVFSFVGLSTLALLWLDASEAAIIAYTMPIWAAVLAWPILGERPTLSRLAGLAVGLAGVAVLLAPLAIAHADAFADKLPGFAAILGTALLFAFGAVLTKRAPPQSSPLVSLAWQIGFATLPITLAALAFDRWQGVHIDTAGWLVLGYVTVIALCLSYFAWFRALHLLPASTAATATLTVPVIGVLTAGLLLREPLGWRQLLALAMTLAGVVLASRG